MCLKNIHNSGSYECTRNMVDFLKELKDAWRSQDEPSSSYAVLTVAKCSV